MGGFWVFSAVVVVILSIVISSLALLLVGTLLLLFVLISKWWADYSLQGVEYKHQLNANRVFSGEDVQLTTQTTNNKFLPLPWIQINDELPKEVSAIQGRVIASTDPTRMALTSVLSMSWYHRTTRTYDIRCPNRGHFFIGPTRIRSGDLFGMQTREMRVEKDQTLTVYPRILPLRVSSLPSLEPYGDVRVKRRFLDDVTRPMGSRKYLSGDALRHIHWKATAHTGMLQTRIFEASTTPNFAVFFGTRTIEPPLQGSRPHLLELGVLTVTALVNYALSRRIPAGVYVNQTSRDSRQNMEVPPARHPDQLVKVLEVMAHVHPEESTPLANLIEEKSRSLPWSTTILVATAIPDQATINTLMRMRKAGWTTALIHVGGEAVDYAREGIAMYTVANTTEWQSLEEIVIQ